MAARKARTPDPPTELTNLERSLEGGGLARAYVFRGDERYFRERAIELVRAKAATSDHELCAHEATRGNPDFRLSALIDDLSGGGLFAPKRLVVVRQPEDALKKTGKENSPLTEAILRFVAAADDPGTLVLSAKSLRLDHAVVKAIVAAGGPVLSLRKLWDSAPPWSPDPTKAELVVWLMQRAREKGVRLNPAQAVYVCAATGNDLFALDDQLDRLSAAGDEAVRDVVGWNAAVTPWAVADPLVDGDLARALFAVESLFSGGFAESSGRRLVDRVALASMLTSSLTRGVRQALRIATELERGRSESDAAAAAGLRGRPAALRTALTRASRRPLGEWRRMLEDVADLERRAKTGVGVDASDFAHLAVRWAPRSAAGGRR